MAGPELPKTKVFAHYHPLFLRNVLKEHLFVEETQLFPGKWVSLLWAEERGGAAGEGAGDARGGGSKTLHPGRAGVREDSSERTEKSRYTHCDSVRTRVTEVANPAPRRRKQRPREATWLSQGHAGNAQPTRPRTGLCSPRPLPSRTPTSSPPRPLGGLYTPVSQPAPPGLFVFLGSTQRARFPPLPRRGPQASASPLDCASVPLASV